MEQACFLCPPAAGKGIPELIEVLGDKEVGGLYHFLQKKTKKEIISPAGGKENLTIDDAVKQYMTHNYPDLEKETYCFPARNGEMKVKDPTNQESSSSAKGELDKEDVIDKFSKMMKQRRIPSFLIHGHNWKSLYLKTVMQLSQEAKEAASDLLKELPKSDGKRNKMNILISLPSKFILSVDVDPVDEVGLVGEEFQKAVLAFRCGGTSQFLSKVFDFQGKVVLVRAVALPSCTRSVTEKLCCEKCGPLVVTADELSTSETLFAWLTSILEHSATKIENSNLSTDAHFDLVSRLVGPASFIEVQTIKDVPKSGDEIDELNAKNKRKEQWCQLTPGQVRVKYRDPQFLLLIGVPGGGKSVLGSWKAAEILLNRQEERPQKRSVLYIITENDSERLKNFYKTGLVNTSSKSAKCELIVKDPTELPKTFKPEDGLRLQMLPSLIKDLQGKHVGKTVHIIYDGCPIPTNTVCRVWFERDMRGLDIGRVGYVWILQDHAITEKDSRRSLPGFETVYLEKIMRMPCRSIDFLNLMMDRSLSPGHTVVGNRILVYRMKCVCDQPKEGICCRCYEARLAWLFKKAKDRFEPEGRRLRFEDYVLLTHDVNAISYSLHLMGYVLEGDDEKYADKEKEDGKKREKEEKSTKSNKPKNVVYCSDVRAFSGCERKIVFVDFDSLCDDFLRQMALTRSTGHFIILDGGCNSSNIGIYKSRRNRVTDMVTSHPGLIEIKNIEATVLDGFMFSKMLDLTKKDEKKDDDEKKKKKSDINKEEGKGDGNDKDRDDK